MNKCNYCGIPTIGDNLICDSCRYDIEEDFYESDEHRHSIPLTSVEGHATFTRNPSIELIELVNKVASIAFTKVRKKGKFSIEFGNPVDVVIQYLGKEKTKQYYPKAKIIQR